MVLQANFLLLGVQLTQYYESMSKHFMQTPFQCFNEKIQVDLLPGMIGLYKLKGRVVELEANCSWESEGVSMEWLYGAAPLTHTFFHTKTLNMGSINLRGASAEANSVNFWVCIKRADVEDTSIHAENARFEGALLCP